MLFDNMVLKLDSLKDDFDVKRLMALDKGESIHQEIGQMEMQIQNYQAEKTKLHKQRFVTIIILTL